jgi:hypothetical protein
MVLSALSVVEVTHTIIVDVSCKSIQNWVNGNITNNPGNTADIP